jgi:predicted glycosyltransferase
MRVIRKYEIDKVISFTHPYGAQAAWFMKKESIIFSDTEHASLHHKLTIPFATEVHTPKCFERELGKKHFRFNSLMELSYLHPNYFNPDSSVLEQLKLDNNNKPITIIRFVSWKAVHDIGHAGITKKDKIKLVKTISEISNVFISSEGEIPNEIKKYELNIDKTKMHSLLHYANLFIGESATMATESAMLGTPAIYMNNLKCGTLNLLDNEYKIITNFYESSKDLKVVTDKAISILNSDKEKY